jgi:predicted DNA-binding transcriptional regulator AlpA
MDGSLDALVRQIVREELDARDAAQSGWLCARAAASYVGISVGSLYNAVSRGALPRTGGKHEKLLFSKAQLDEYVQNRRKTAPSFEGGRSN